MEAQGHPYSGKPEGNSDVEAQGQLCFGKTKGTSFWKDEGKSVVEAQGQYSCQWSYVLSTRSTREVGVLIELSMTVVLVQSLRMLWLNHTLLCPRYTTETLPETLKTTAVAVDEPHLILQMEHQSTAHSVCVL